VDLDEILYGGNDVEGKVDHCKMADVKLVGWLNFEPIRDLYGILNFGNGIEYDFDHSKMAVCMSPTTKF
jgi:hypothetical protein